jgi:hypothetical protein
MAGSFGWRCANVVFAIITNENNKVMTYPDLDRSLLLFILKIYCPL